MSKYAYPAIFTPEENGSFSIVFPDLESCYTCGTCIEDGLEMAEDVLALTLYGYEIDGRPAPKPSEAKNIPLSGHEFINYVKCDTMEYRKLYNSKAVKKTLTIPQWLNEEATARGINFSAVLQDALKARLDI